MRYQLLLAALATAASLSAAPVPKQKVLPLADRLNGAWEVQTRETEGGITDGETTTWTISEGKLISTRGGGMNTWTLTLDVDSDPAHYDLSFANTRYTGIIEVDGDSLRVCHTIVGYRPKSFSTEQGAEIVILRRVRPRK